MRWLEPAFSPVIEPPADLDLKTQGILPYVNSRSGSKYGSKEVDTPVQENAAKKGGSSSQADKRIQMPEICGEELQSLY
jgi:hypothetical protein